MIRPKRILPDGIIQVTAKKFIIGTKATDSTSGFTVPTVAGLCAFGDDDAHITRFKDVVDLTVGFIVNCSKPVYYKLREK